MKIQMLIMYYMQLEFWEKWHWKYFKYNIFVTPNSKVLVDKLINNVKLMSFPIDTFKFWIFLTENQNFKKKLQCIQYLDSYPTCLHGNSSFTSDSELCELFSLPL